MFSISKKVLYPAVVVLVLISLSCCLPGSVDQANSAPEVSSS